MIGSFDVGCGLVGTFVKTTVEPTVRRRLSVDDYVNPRKSVFVVRFIIRYENIGAKEDVIVKL